MIHSTIGICLGLYIVICIFAFICSLDLTCGDILNNYKNDDPICFCWSCQTGHNFSDVISTTCIARAGRY